MMEVKLRKIPVLDRDFRPMALVNKAFLEAVKASGQGSPVAIGVERENGQVAVYRTEVFAGGSGKEEESFRYIERLTKSLLWIKGGWKIIIGGPRYIGERIKEAYAPGGSREFDARFMGRVYEKEFTVELTEADRMPEEYEKPEPVGKSLNGCRIGFDAGGSNRKVAAVRDGEVLYIEEAAWQPMLQEDPDYHYREILQAVKTAAEKLPRVDGLGVSSAGIYVNNRTRIASLFLKVSEDLFDKKIKNIYLDVAKELGDIPVVVKNDGDVAALAGAMSLKVTKIMGIAMGTSEAAGYVDENGNITGCLNELAFVPVDYNPRAMVDEWSGDTGCGVKYFSQDAVVKLAPAAGIELEENLTPAEKLRVVQGLLEKGDEKARQIYETIGCYLGYTLGYYADFYDLKHLLLLGGVASGAGGVIILETAREVLALEYPELAEKLNLHLPGESNRRIVQAVAAAALPVL